MEVNVITVGSLKEKYFKTEWVTSLYISAFISNDGLFSFSEIIEKVPGEEKLEKSNILYSAKNFGLWVK